MSEAENKEILNAAEGSETPEVVDVKPKKRGRKPNPEKRTGYFYEEQEDAFRQYMESDNKRFRDKIFRTKLYPAFTKMIESIIRRYGLFTPSEDFSDTFHDTMSFLVTKLDKFDPSKGYKAYSYFGTICKRYLLLKRTNDMKMRDTTISYDILFGPTGDNRSTFDGSFDSYPFHTELIRRNVRRIQRMINTTGTDALSETEKQVGLALIEIFTNWENLFMLSPDRKFNKTTFMYFVKEYTMLESKDVREAMKRFKDVYFDVKQKLIDE